MYGSMPRLRVPVELRATPPPVLEEYVRARLGQFAGLLSQRLAHYVPNLSRDAMERASGEALALMPLPEHGPVGLEDKQLQLVFRHDCLALGCLDPQCALCQHNPNRRCSVNFDRKYLVNDVLKARCLAGIRVELIDPATGLPVEDKLPELTLQISVLDGNLYDQKFLESGKQFEGGTEPPEELEACALLLNKKKNTPLLVCGVGGNNDNNGFVLLNMSEGKVLLQDLHVTDSSEAILSGRKPPFRLLVRALQPAGSRLKIRHAVSEGFVVATRRTRTAGKVDIPSVDDHVSKLEHMGKETVKKLQDLRTAAQQAGVEIDIPENCVQKVGEFKLLALRADQDGHLRQKLQHVLKLSKEKWEEARDHAMRAVVADSRMRAWYSDRRNMDVGMLVTCRLGNVDLDRPVGLLQNKVENGEKKVEAILVAQLTPAQRELMRHLQPQAVAAWWTQGHPGWAIFPMDSDQFLQTGNLAMPSLLDAPPSPPNNVRRQSNHSGLGNHSEGVPMPDGMHMQQQLSPALGNAPALPSMQPNLARSRTGSFNDRQASQLDSPPHHHMSQQGYNMQQQQQQQQAMQMQMNSQLQGLMPPPPPRPQPVQQQQQQQQQHYADMQYPGGPHPPGPSGAGMAHGMPGPSHRPGHMGPPMGRYMAPPDMPPPRPVRETGALPPNPFLKVQAEQSMGGLMTDIQEDSPQETLLATLPSLPLTNSMFQAAMAGQIPAGHMPPPGMNVAVMHMNGMHGMHQHAHLHNNLPSLNMLDSQQLEMMLQENMETSLTTGLTYGLFLPSGMTLAEGGLPVTASKELKQTSSGLDTMQSIEHALPDMNKGPQFVPQQAEGHY